MRGSTFRKLWLTWTFAGLLTLLCATLAVVQNRWINEVSAAERDRLQAARQTSLNRLSRDFDEQIARSYTDLKPSFADITEFGTQVACARQYERWRASSEPLFRRIAIVNLEAAEPRILLFNLTTGLFAPAAWPVEWDSLRKRFDARNANAPVPPIPAAESALLDFPLFGSMHQSAPPNAKAPTAPPKEDWLVAEVALDYARAAVIPALMEKYIVSVGMPAYDAVLQPVGVDRGGPKIPDASVDLLDSTKLQQPLAGHRVRPDCVCRFMGEGRHWRIASPARGGATWLCPAASCC